MIEPQDWNIAFATSVRRRHVEKSDHPFLAEGFQVTWKSQADGIDTAELLPARERGIESAVKLFHGLGPGPHRLTLTALERAQRLRIIRVYRPGFVPESPQELSSK